MGGAFRSRDVHAPSVILSALQLHTPLRLLLTTSTFTRAVAKRIELSDHSENALPGVVADQLALQSERELVGVRTAVMSNRRLRAFSAPLNCLLVNHYEPHS